MNYKGFKKVHEDNEKAVLKNPHGHSITIAKKVLSKDHLEDLKKLPLHAAHGTEGDDSSDSQDNYASDSPATSETATHPVNININTQPGQMASSQVPIQGQQGIPQVQQGAAQGQPAPENSPLLNALRQKTQNQVSESPLNQKDQDNESDEETEQPQVEDRTQEIQNIRNQRLNAIGQSPEGQPGNEEENNESSIQPQVALSNPQAYKALALQKYNTEDKAFENDLNNGHITPKTYGDLFNEKSTLGKIGTVFGLLLSGAGSGLSHQPNAALSIMNQEIQNDLDAQKTSKINAENYLRMNQAHQLQQAQIPKLYAEGKLTLEQAKLMATEANQKAYALSQMQMNRAAFHKLTADMQNLPQGSPQRLQAEQTLGLMYQAINNENFNISDRAAAASSLANFGSAPSQPVNSEANFQQKDRMLRLSGNTALATDLESKHFPGLQGQSSVPLSGSDRDKLNSGINFDRQLNDFIDWTKNHSGSLSPKDFKTGLAKAAEVQAGYRAATNGGIYREGEQNFISRIVDSDPTKFFNSIRVVPQLQAVAQSNHDRVDQTAKNLGFAGFQKVNQGETSQRQVTSKAMTEGQTGTYQGKPVIFKNGKWSYQ